MYVCMYLCDVYNKNPVSTNAQINCFGMAQRPSPSFHIFMFDTKSSFRDELIEDVGGCGCGGGV